MSLLNQLFNRGVFASKCKTCLNLAISRFKLVRNKRDLQLKHMRKEIAQFLQAGQEAIARIRVEHVIREQNIWAAYEILELFCEFILARVPIIESQRECPTELREAIASIIFAAPRCSEVPDLLNIKNLFATKYGKEFTMVASELRPDSGVNRTIIEKLSPSPPSPDVRLKVLKEIALENNLNWDSSATEAEFGKSHEDLLGGPKQISHQATASEAPFRQSFNGTANVPSETKQGSIEIRASNSPSATSGDEVANNTTYHSLPSREPRKEGESQTSDAQERARDAIATAERATAAARAAAQLANIQFGLLKLQDGKSL